VLSQCVLAIAQQCLVVQGQTDGGGLECGHDDTLVVVDLQCEREAPAASVHASHTVLEQKCHAWPAKDPTMSYSLRALKSSFFIGTASQHRASAWADSTEACMHMYPEHCLTPILQASWNPAETHLPPPCRASMIWDAIAPLQVSSMRCIRVPRVSFNHLERECKRFGESATVETLKDPAVVWLLPSDSPTPAALPFQGRRLGL
jgi:hypothetical protein